MSGSRRASVSFTAMPPSVLGNSQHVSEEDIQITLAPCIQTYLSQTGRRHSCCSVMLPVAFERAAPKSWFDPCFDSQVLEGQYQASVFPQIRLRFRFSLFYILLCALVWMIYFLNGGATQHHWISLSTAFALLIVITGLLLWLTQSNFYRAHTHIISGCTAILFCLVSLCFLSLTSNAFSPLGHFAICIEIILLIYTVIPLRLWQNILIASVYSIVFELLTHFLGNNYYFNEKPLGFCYKILALRFLLQICVHLVGVHVLIMNIVRMRGTFMKIGQNLLVRRQLEMEKQLKEKMIHSVMPPKVADMLLKEGGGGAGGGGPSNIDPSDSHRINNYQQQNDTQQYQYHQQQMQRTGYRISNDIKTLFRPFHMHSMDNVSILFADIVGFTKMSSTKTAEQLVEILNDLFERFDDLCTSCGCEKISTLGDCYYCVSGCPEPRPDHAICCVEMGLGMISAMEAFDAQRHEGVTMRVGVHTGTVLCGIVGTRRVKFDVWSNDVTFANRMESTGRPGQVHISEETCSFLSDSYVLEEGEDVEAHRTYFVVNRKRDRHNSSSYHLSQTDLLTNDPYLLLIANPMLSSNGSSEHHHLSQSATNLSVIQPQVPPASPVGQTSTSLNPSPILSVRPRLASFNKVTKFLITSTSTNNQQQNSNTTSQLHNNKQNNIVNCKKSIEHPKIVITTKSLPGSLDLDNDDKIVNQEFPSDIIINNSSTIKCKDNELANESSRYLKKFKNWKIPKFLRKNNEHINQSHSHSDHSSSITVNVMDGSIANQKSSLMANTTTNNVIENDYQSHESNGGYQPLPIVIETNPSSNTLDVPLLNRYNQHQSSSATNSRSPDTPSPGHHSIFDDIIDVRSYISQSRSDISPFARSNSYKSQCGGDLSPNPGGRPRASTIVYPHQSHQQCEFTQFLHQCNSNCSSHHNNNNNNNNNTNNNNNNISNHSNSKCFWNDGLSTCASANSRKDSGIRSNSRRSSIHQQFFPSICTIGPPTTTTCSATTTTLTIPVTTTTTISNMNGPTIEIIKPTNDEGDENNDKNEHAEDRLQISNINNNQDPTESNQKHLHLHRVSGYFTSSQSSINDNVQMVRDHVVITPYYPQKLYEPHPDPLGACLQKLRKQSDLQLIRCVRDNAKSQRNYLVKPPISNFTLFFRSQPMEREFRSKAHRFGNELNEMQSDMEQGPPTLATPKYNTYIDIFVGLLIFFAISASLFLLSSTSTDALGIVHSTIDFNIPFRIWLSLFLIFSILQCFALFLFTKQMCRRLSNSSTSPSFLPSAAARTSNDSGGNRTSGNPIGDIQQKQQRSSSSSSNGRINLSSMKPTFEDRIFQVISGWYPWHICLSILMALPVILIIVNFSLQDFDKLAAFEYHYGFLIFICIIQFCNFTQLNCWIRNILAMLCALAFVGIALGQMDAITSYRTASNDTTTVSPLINDQHYLTKQNNTTNVLPLPSSLSLLSPNIISFNNNEFIVSDNFTILANNNNNNAQSDNIPISHHSSASSIVTNTRTIKLNWFQEYHVEIYLDLLLVLILVWFLNREFEIGYRLTFYGNAVANQDKIRVQNMKNQADMLLHNIIPKHVAEQLKNTAKYSENHRNIGIIFASIVNFNELYDESYLGGKEYLRVLNELIGDFDELLCRPEFRCVEKIKTIGSTFMAASGLDPYTRTENDNEHIQILMHFAIAMQHVVDAFNKDLLEFNLVLRIGFNVGDVTAGVIGTSKLHYDIWGDAVNVASRMDSTGIPGNIQIGKNCIPFLQSQFECEPRGSVYVKGKDHMEVFLIKHNESDRIVEFY